MRGFSPSASLDFGAVLDFSSLGVVVGVALSSTASSFSSDERHLRPREFFPLVPCFGWGGNLPVRGAGAVFGVSSEGGFLWPGLVGSDLGCARLVGELEPEMSAWHDVGRCGIFLLEPPRCLSPPFFLKRSLT